MFKLVLRQRSYWPVGFAIKIMAGSNSYQPLTSRSKSMPLTKSRFFSMGKNEAEIDEVDDASVMTFRKTNRKQKEDEQEMNDKTNGKRKLGVFLTGTAAGSIAAGIWTYGDLKKESLKAAEVVVQEKGESSTPSRRERFNFIAEVVAETGPALVYIEVKGSKVREFSTNRASNGSGFIVRQNGLILTNAHVITDVGSSRTTAIQVRLQDGRTFLGDLEAVDAKSDLALIRIACEDLPVIKLGKSSDILPGEFVVAMGSPLALSNTITTGVVSSACRNKRELGLEVDGQIPEYIQTDAAITFGNSGGPLINLDGEAIGINSMKVTAGISFAIPIDYAKEFLQKASQFRPKSKRRFMGITMLAITPQIIDQLKERMNYPLGVESGIVVYSVVEGSPADVSGIEPMDVITQINGINIKSSGGVYELLETSEDLFITLIRNNVVKYFHVRPEE